MEAVEYAKLRLRRPRLTGYDGYEWAALGSSGSGDKFVKSFETDLTEKNRFIKPSDTGQHRRDPQAAANIGVADLGKSFH